jgi:hypothetical protein
MEVQLNFYIWKDGIKKLSKQLIFILKVWKIITNKKEIKEEVYKK